MNPTLRLSSYLLATLRDISARECVELAREILEGAKPMREMTP